MLLAKIIKTELTKNISLLISSLFITIVFFEILFRLLIIDVPIKFHVFIPEPIRYLAQNSKSGIAPKNYIAILGDSYALGAGDWLINSINNGDRDFHSAHILKKVTGKDVLSFGWGGAGSLTGMITSPISGLLYLNSTLLYKIEDPSLILIYFYEGNDLTDNIVDIQHRFFPGYDKKKLRDPAYFGQFINETVLGKDKNYKAAKTMNISKNFIFTRSIVRLIKEFIKSDENELLSQPQPNNTLPGEINKIRINGVVEAIPDELQAPALELREDEVETSLYVFEQALKYLVNSFSGKKIALVYIPSPLSCYELASQDVFIQPDIAGRGSLYPVKKVKEQSDYIANFIKSATEKYGVSFIDSRNKLRKTASIKKIHGSKDWRHFNRDGYTALSEVILDFLKNQEKSFVINPLLPINRY